jgi:hypothetical protein
VLAGRREGSLPETPEFLRCAEDEASNFDVSLVLEKKVILPILLRFVRDDILCDFGPMIFKFLFNLWPHT